MGISNTAGEQCAPHQSGGGHRREKLKRRRAVRRYERDALRRGETPAERVGYRGYET